MSLLAQYLRGAGVLTAQAFVQRLLGVVTSIVLARGLGVTGFGGYSAVINTASAAYGVLRLGVEAAIHVSAAKGKQDSQSGCLTSELLGAGLLILATAGLAAAAILTLSSDWLAIAIFGQPELAGPLKFAGILTALQCLSQFSYATLAGFQKFVAYARIMILVAVLILVLSAIGMWLYGLVGALGGYGVAQGILAALLGREAALAMREQGIRIAFSRLARAVATLIRLGGPFYLSGLVAIPVVYFLQGLLSRSAGIDALGLLRVIGTITAIIAFVPASIAAVTTSMLTRVRADSAGSATRLFDYAFLHIKVVWYLTTLLAMILAIATPILVELLFGTEFAAAIEPGIVALFSTALGSTAGSVGSLLFAVERSEIIFWQSVSQSIVLAAVGILIIPGAGLLGYVGAEVAGNAVAVVFVLVAASVMSREHRHMEKLLWTSALCFVASFSAIILSILVTDCVSRIIWFGIAAVLLTAGLFRFALTEWETSIIRRMLGRGN